MLLSALYYKIATECPTLVIIPTDGLRQSMFAHTGYNRVRPSCHPGEIPENVVLEFVRTVKAASIIAQCARGNRLLYEHFDHVINRFDPFHRVFGEQPGPKGDSKKKPYSSLFDPKAGYATNVEQASPKLGTTAWSLMHI